MMFPSGTRSERLLSSLNGFGAALRPLIVKEFRQIRRDPTSLGMLLFLPAALIMLVGYALNFDVKHIPLGLYDQDRTPASRALLDNFRHSEYFDLKLTASSYGEIEHAVARGTLKAAIVVPKSFSADQLAGRAVKVQIIVDGSDANSAGQAVAVASRMMLDHSINLSSLWLSQSGRGLYRPVDFQPRIWYNPDLVSTKFLLPGLIGFILVLTAVVSTSLTIVREKERGTMEQIMVSPLHPSHVILGKTIPYLLISLVASVIVLLLGNVMFDVQVAGSIMLLFVAILILVIGALGQGLLISTVTDSQQVAFIVSVFSSLLPSFLLSGFVFPVSSMPVALQIISNIAVAKYFLVICRGIILKGAGFGALWEQYVYLSLFAVIILLLSIRRMKKDLV